MLKEGKHQTKERMRRKELNRKMIQVSPDNLVAGTGTGASLELPSTRTKIKRKEGSKGTRTHPTEIVKW